LASAIILKAVDLFATKTYLEVVSMKNNAFPAFFLMSGYQAKSCRNAR